MLPSRRGAASPLLAVQRLPRRVLYSPPGCLLPRGRADDEVRDRGRVEVRPPALLGVPGELEVVPLTRHPGRDGADAAPGVEPGSEDMDLWRVSLHPREGERGGERARRRCDTELFDHLIRPQQQRRRDGEAEGAGGLEVDDQLEFGRLLDRDVVRLCAP